MATQAVSKISGYKSRWPLAKETPELDCARLAKNSCASENAAEANTRAPLLHGFLQSLLPRFFFERSSMIVTDILVIFLNVVLLLQLAKLPAISGLFQYSGILFPAPGGAQPFMALSFLFAIIFALLGAAERIDAPHSTFADPNTIVLARCTGWAAISAAGTAYFLHQSNLFPYVVVLAIASFISCLAWRGFFQSAICTPRPRRVVIAGTGALGRALSLRIRNQASYKFLGFADCAALPARNMLGKIDDLPAIALQTFADEIIVAFPQQPEVTAKVIEIARRLNVNVKVAIETFGCDVCETGLEQLSDIVLLPVLEKREPLIQACLKRSADILLSIFALLVTAPLMSVIAAIVKLDSPGPVLYHSLRAGRRGDLFTCYKFRTMACDADQRKDELRTSNERSGPFFKLTNDPRITRSGKFLRRYSLDELPQFWNVLRGEMSLVGPRPHPVDDFQRYEVEHLRRLEAVPGMTGLWQVTARRDPSFQRNMALDLEYIEHGTLWMDVKVLFKTLSVILQGNGV